MARLKITRASGDTIVQITPAIEVAFESKFNNGIHKQFRDMERQSDIYWLSWECLRRQEIIAPFGDGFLETLISVEVMDDELPNA